MTQSVLQKLTAQSPPVLTYTLADPRYGSVWDIRRFVQTGDTWATDGSADTSVVQQRAHDAGAASYAATGIPVQIFYPEGKYKNNTAITARSGVGVNGAGPSQTVFIPPTNNSYIVGTSGSVGSPYTDMVFSNFSIDGAAQTSGSYTTSIKGIFIQHMLRARFTNVHIRNCYATGFGVDHLRDSFFSVCLAQNNGRGLTDPTSQSGGSGFGIGTGASARESITMEGCIASGNGFNGFFTEKQTSVSNYAAGFRMVGCHSYANYNGFKDAGSDGAVITGCQFTDNTNSGVSIDSTILTPNAGYNGIISDCIITGNNTDANASGAGVIIGAAALGRYTIRDNDINHNTGPGIRISGNAAKDFSIKDNEVSFNTASGIWSSTALTLTSMEIADNRCYNNGTDTAQVQRDGITIESPMTNCVIRGNICYDSQTVKTQQYGLHLAGVFANDVALATTINDLRFNAAGAYSVEHTIDGNSIFRNNDGVDFSQANSLVVSAIGDTTATLHWNAPTDAVPGAPITDYTIQYGTSSSGPWTTWSHSPSTAVTQIVTGLTNGTLYYFHVRYETSTTSGTYSSVASGTPVGPLYSDSFNRADSATTMGATDGGSAGSPLTWITSVASGSAQWGIQSNRAYIAGGAQTSFSVIDTGIANGTIQVTVADVGEFIGALVFREVQFDDATYLALYGTPTSSHFYSVYSKNSGVASNIFQSTIVPANGDILRVVMNGSLLKFSVNGVPLWSVTSTKRLTATKHGILGNSTTGPGVRWDNWSISPSVL